MKIGFACGVFDLFHAGHVLMLKECRENCDHLVVGLNSGLVFDLHINPGKERPLFSLEERKLILESCRFVDEVIVYNSEKELITILQDRQFNVRFLGDDYRGRPITGAEYTSQIYYINRDHGLSTSFYKNLLKEK